jgi:uncharacterized protein (TIGR03083 family)
MESPSYRTIVEAVRTRHLELVSLLRECDQRVLTDPSELPGWNRLTVVCHLRYGAEANTRMTRDILNGFPTAFYPEGPEQRPATLTPRSGETFREVITSLEEASTILDTLWETLSGSEWEKPLIEPGGKEDLGSLTLGHLALLRLTEVEVHGTDLDIGAADWSEEFVRAALPMRVHWLARRRPHPQYADYSIQGTWVLEAVDGEAFSITASSDGVRVQSENTSGVEGARLRGTRRDLLGFLLGRISTEDLEVSGNAELASCFHPAFPPP